MLLDQAKLAASFSFLVATMPSNNDHNNPNTNNLLPAEENMSKEERKEFEKAVAAQKKKEQNERKMAADAKARLAVGRIGTIWYFEGMAEGDWVRTLGETGYTSEANEDTENEQAYSTHTALHVRPKNKKDKIKSNSKKYSTSSLVSLY